jgi:phosphatidylinositol alpha-mannosyltransferase
VRALGKVSEQRKLAELRNAHVLCAPSLGGESFGMVLTEAFAAGTPVLASDIPGYRDVLRDGRDGELVPAGDPLALAHALRGLALEEPRRARMAASARERAERYAWPAVAAEVSECYERARRIGAPSARPAALAVRYGLVPADRQPRIPAERLKSLQGPPARPVPGAQRPPHSTIRRLALLASSLAAGVLATVALQRVGLTRVAGSLLASKPGLVAAALGVMCTAMFARAIAWHSILAVAPTWRRATTRDAMQGTFIGVLMSATRPARLGEASRALIVSRRIGRARETLPLVLGTMVSQTLLNLLALALLAAGMLASADYGNSAATACHLAAALAPMSFVLLARAGAAAGRSGRLHTARFRAPRGRAELARASGDGSARPPPRAAALSTPCSSGRGRSSAAQLLAAAGRLRAALEHRLRRRGGGPLRRQRDRRLPVTPPTSASSRRPAWPSSPAPTTSPHPARSRSRSCCS